MKFNFNSFFKSKQNKEIRPVTEDYDDSGFTKFEMEEYDKNVNFFYTNIVNSLILYTYNVEQLDKMVPILIDPLTELYEELDYAYHFFLKQFLEINCLMKVLKKNFYYLKRKLMISLLNSGIGNY